jgi:hypothetical protein
LASLKVVLNEAACHEPDEEDDARWKCCRYGPDNEYRPCKEVHIGVHSRPLASGTSLDNGDDVPAAQILSSEWRAAAAYLSAHFSPGQLELSVVCDIDHRPEDAHEMAKSVVAPFQFLPRLRDCHVRLCDVPDPRLQQLAQDAVLQVRRVATPPYHKPPTAQAAFVTLPRELRLRILEYTDLITPWKEVSWSRLAPAYTILGSLCRVPDYPEDPCRFPDHNGCQFLRCSVTLEHGCFCRRYHSAFSSACRCWSPPGPALFLICRTLCLDAQLVFFSGNRFIVHDCSHPEYPFMTPLPPGPPPGQGPGDAATGYYPWERFNISDFLREVVPRHCLAYLRFLELVFPPYYHDQWPKPEHPAMQDWCATVDWLRDKINAPGLTVWLVTASSAMDEYSDRVPGPITDPEGKAVLAGYINILLPLKCLADDGLARFYAQWDYPEAWTQNGYKRMMRQPGLSSAWLEARQRELREQVERYILQDRYDAQYAGGKEDPAKSMWQFPPDPYAA